MFGNISTTIGTTPMAILEHKGRVLQFNVSVFGRRTLDPENPFFHINKYWDGLSEDKQDALFHLYEQAAGMFESYRDWRQLSEGISLIVVELFKFHDLAYLKQWISFKTDISIPSVIPTEFVEDIDSKNSREKTYTKPEYAELLALSLMLRCLIPIWGDYIFCTRSEFGNREKEKQAFNLIIRSGILSTPVFQRLENYITAILPSDRADDKSIESGTSSEDYARTLLALVCVKRLCVAQLKPVEATAHLCTAIHNYVTQRTDSKSSQPEETIRPKKPGGGDGDENKLSTAEQYHGSADKSPGDLMEMEVFFKDIYGNVQSVFQNVDHIELANALNKWQELVGKEITPVQMALVGHILSPIMSAHALQYQPLELQLKSIKAAETILLSKGHHYLAFWISSFISNSESVMSVTASTKPMKLAQELQDELLKHYPFQIQSGYGKNIRTEYYILTTLDQYVEVICSNNWKPTACQNALDGFFGSFIRTLPSRPEIRNLVGQLLIDIGSGQLFN